MEGSIEVKETVVRMLLEQLDPCGSPPPPPPYSKELNNLRDEPW